ncbi:MAG: DUF58 domain-containing protein [Bacteroidales bacterium]|nr:DUF58 domain-containing protein [Bacteroidales bacterium]
MNLDHIHRYRSLDLYARQVVEGFITGRHRSPFHGFSAEFSDYRQYNPGEPTRNIDYRLYGRTDRLYVKQFEEETNLRCQLFIDCSRSMLFPLERHADPDQPNKLTFSAYAAAVLIELLHRQRDAFGLSLFAPETPNPDTQNSSSDTQNSKFKNQNSSLSHTPCRSSRLHQQHLLAQLDTLLQPVQIQNSKFKIQNSTLPEALHLTAEHIHRRSLVVIFTDALLPQTSSLLPQISQEPLFDALRHLRHNKHEVILFHTYHSVHELNLDYGDRPTLFIDLETGQQLRLTPSQIADRYRQQMASDFASLQQHALQYRIDYQPVDVCRGFHQVLLPFLLKRNKSR